MNKLLVTGGMGFVGSNFIRYWLEHHPQDTIVNLDLLTHAGNVENLRSVRDLPNYQFIQGDICSSLLVNKLIAEGFDYIVHFAAESLNERMIQNPLTVVRSNIEGTQHLLEAVKKEGIRKFIHVSTDEVYGSLKGKCTEQTPLSPNSLYAASKAGADLLVHAYYQIYGLPVVITRCSANYGPYQFPDQWIPAAIIRIIRNEKMGIDESVCNIWNWVYVEDHCRAIELVLLDGQIGEIYNISSHNERNNVEWLQQILSLMGRGEERIGTLKEQKEPHSMCSLDTSKIRNELGWIPQYDLKDGLQKTVRWYIEHEQWWKRIYTGEYRIMTLDCKGGAIHDQRSFGY